MKKLSYLLLILITFSCTTGPEKQVSQLNVKQTVEAKNGMVATAHPLASEVGAQILRQGGNAFDAAVAVQFALAVVYPRAGNIAGGGFAVYRKANGETGSLDFREKAPLTATYDMYLDEDENVIPKLSSFGVLSIGIPGSVDGMIELHKKLGSLPFERLIQPAIDLAENGFILTQNDAKKLNYYQKDFLNANDSTTYFFNGGKWQVGDKIVLPELAHTLKLIRDNGRKGFYAGETAQEMLDEIHSSNGIISQADFDAYHSIWRKPIEGKYKDYKVISMPPPSSGGIALLQLLKGSEQFSFAEFGHNSTQSIHLMTELERRVYADRATYLGDSDFYDVPIDMLLDSAYLANRFSDIHLDSKTDSKDIKEGNVEIIESIETTHFSIVDKDQNAIGITTTLNGNFGSKVFVEKSGFFLNNEMDDFSAKPGIPNQFGLVGAEANAIAPEKRMLSSMTPTILEKNGKLFMVVGSPGGATIITAVYQTILNVVEYGMDMQQAVNASKTHHQWLPDRILYENNGLDSLVIKQLQKMGHKMEPRSAIGKMDAVLILPDGTMQGGADPRGDDTAVGVK
ncbi:MAG: gamma-glutamyltransferase [Bacteroidetes bacterium]|nr:MAG: gamma-glutamyltransferase [Bacteroidota bacterium]